MTDEAVRDWTVPMPYGVDTGVRSDRDGDEHVLRFTGTRAELLGVAQMIIEHVGHDGPCRAALNIAGEHFGCEETHPHRGWAHGSRAAKAVWISHEDVLRNAQDWRAARDAGH